MSESGIDTNEPPLCREDQHVSGENIPNTIKWVQLIYTTMDHIQNSFITSRKQFGIRTRER